MAGELIAATFGFLAARATGFLDAVIKPTAKAVGEDLLTRYRSWQGQNLAAVVTDASELLHSVGQAPQPVPGRILFPILEYASVEEDDSLRRKWAALLANAASVDNSNRVLPAYAEILRQLVPQQAEILDWIYFGQSDIELSGEPRTFAETTQEAIQEKFGLTADIYNLLAADLHRLQVIDGGRYVQTRMGGSMASMTTYKRISLTSLGLGFVAACRRA